ncbi:MAG: STAS domain-containing protein [Candidatus Wallbacteria bacterium]|nr:STAS domain-containing protein [Candidatus Wallbacteria bacterium]
MHIEESCSGETLVISLSGSEIGTRELSKAKDIFDSVPAECSSLRLDLSQLSYINSSLLSLIVGTCRRITGNGGEVCIHNPTSFVRRILHITNIEDIVGIFDGESGKIKTSLVYDLPPVKE